jgi:hypothetical protein
VDRVAHSNVAPTVMIAIVTVCVNATNVANNSANGATIHIRNVG